MIQFEITPAPRDPSWSREWRPQGGGEAVTLRNLEQNAFVFRHFSVQLWLSTGNLSVNTKGFHLPAIDLVLTFELIKNTLARDDSVTAATSEDQLTFVCHRKGEEMSIRVRGRSGESSISFSEFLDFCHQVSIRVISLLYAAHEDLRVNPYLMQLAAKLNVAGEV